MSGFYFGIGRKCLNPEIPITLAGYFSVRMWEKVLDDIEVRALALKSEGKFAFIIQFDLITVSTELYEATIKAFANAGINEVTSSNLIMTATHSHTAPEVRNPKTGSNPNYVNFAAAKAADALRDALSDMQSGGSLEYGITAEHRFMFNRRYWMKSGQVVTNPGKMNPDILTSEGDIDPEIPIIAIRQNGKIKVLLANIVNHTDTIGGNDVSGDWAGFTIRTMQKELGAGSMVLPLIGCAGNINHFDVKSNCDQTCYAEAERIGVGYAAAISKALNALKPMSSNTFKTVHQTLNIAPRVLEASEIAEAQAVIEQYPDVVIDGVSGADLTSEDLAKRTPFALKFFAAKLLEMKDEKEIRNFLLTGIKFGDDAVIASLPCEPFVEIGMTIRKAIFGDYLTMAVSHSNGTGSLKFGGGYIPNAWNYGRGGYETTPRSSFTDKKTSEMLINKWREIADEF